MRPFEKRLTRIVTVLQISSRSKRLCIGFPVDLIYAEYRLLPHAILLARIWSAKPYWTVIIIMVNVYSQTLFYQTIMHNLVLLFVTDWLRQQYNLNFTTSYNNDHINSGETTYLQEEIKDVSYPAIKVQLSFHTLNYLTVAFYFHP